jgi:hypothetical protein
MKIAMMLILATTLFQISCLTADDDAIQKARACLDNKAKTAFTDSALAASEVSECTTALGSVDTQEANKIKFGIFLIENQKLARLADFANAMKNPAGTNRDGLTAAFPVLIVSTTTVAGNGVIIANKTGSAGIMTVAQMINLSTLMSAGTSGINISASDTADQVFTKVNTCVATCTAQQKQDLATALISAQSAACADGTDANSTDNNNPCKVMKDVINGSTDPNTIVANLATYLASNH